MKLFWLIPFLYAPFSWAAPYAAVVMDPASGMILDGVSHKKSIYPASLTKMMTLFLLFEALEKKKVSLRTPFKVSAYASAQPPGKLGVKAGKTLTVRECILSLAVRSANDVAVVVAENLAGSVKAFAQCMNKTAHRLRLHHTHFCNPSGLHNPRQSTTATDMALLTRALWKHFPKYTFFLGLPSFMRNKILYRNTSKLHQRLLGLKMGKTGYTQPAGWNLALLTVRNRRPLIVVVMGMSSAAQRDAHMERLIQAFYTTPHKVPSLLRRPVLAKRASLSRHPAPFSKNFLRKVR